MTDRPNYVIKMGLTYYMWSLPGPRRLEASQSPSDPGVQARIRERMTRLRERARTDQPAKKARTFLDDWRDAASALRYINRHRARVAQRPLKPAAAGWTDDDLIAEAKRLGWSP